jgi:putative peptide zinc metalloprotease protein
MNPTSTLATTGAAAGEVLDPVPLDSPLWYRVANIVPRLRPTVRVRHRGQPGQARHVLADLLTGRHHLLDEAAWSFVGRFDGRRTIGEIWTWLSTHRAQPPTQHEVLEWLAHLDSAGLLQSDRLPDLQALMRGEEQVDRRRRRASLNPLSWRVPLGDPTRWLTRLDPLARVLAHPLTLLLALAIVGAGLMQTALAWPSLQADLRERLGSPTFLALSWGVYPLIKALHELGHALAVRRCGAEVRHVGIGFLYLVPAPYVDASAATGLSRRRERILISAAGVLVESVLAAVGVLVWSAVEPGRVRDLALSVALVGGVSTVLANANPLVRMDGYHVLTDALDLPNLAQRSRRWWFDRLQGWLGGLRTASALPAGSALQRGVTLVYAPAAWLFGVLVATSACLWLAQTAAMLALMAGAIALWMLVGGPLLASLRWLARAPALRGRRLRAATIGLVLTGALLAGVLLVPIPQATIAQAQGWMPEDALVRAPADGFVVAIDAPADSEVQASSPLVTLHSDEQPVELATLRARRLALEVQVNRLQVQDAAAAQRAEAEVAMLQAREVELAQRIAQMAVHSVRAGRVSWIEPQTLVGRYVRRGELLGYVLAGDRLVARTVVPDEDIAWLLAGVRSVSVMRPEEAGQAYAGRWDGVVPETGSVLPAAALGVRAGGQIETDPADADGLRTLRPVAVVDVQVPALAVERLGARLLVRFDHGAQPLGARLLRRLQQLTLRHLGEATDVPGGR